MNSTMGMANQSRARAGVVVPGGGATSPPKIRPLISKHSLVSKAFEARRNIAAITPARARTNTSSPGISRSRPPNLRQRRATRRKKRGNRRPAARDVRRAAKPGPTAEATANIPPTIVRLSSPQPFVKPARIMLPQRAASQGPSRWPLERWKLRRSAQKTDSVIQNVTSMSVVAR